MNFKRVMAAMIVSCSLVSVVSPLEMGVNDINETAEAAQKETELNIEVEPVNAPIVSAEPEIEWKTGYVSASKLNIRKKPSTDSKIVGSLSFNKKVKYYEYDDEWACIKRGERNVYVALKYISDEKATYKTFDMPMTSGKKSWMPHTKASGKSIFSKSSKQFELQQLCYTGTYGIRMYDGRFCVALGSHFTTEIGQYFDLVLENGTVIPCVLGDAKSDYDTDSANIVTVDSGCATEFVVDRTKLNSDAKRDGDMSSCSENWNSRVVKILVYEENALNE